MDRDLKPNSDERRAIAAVLRLPPNRPLGGEERALLWRYRRAAGSVRRRSRQCHTSAPCTVTLRFLRATLLSHHYRYSLRGDKRALTKFLKSVDWSDAQEARQVGPCMLSSHKVVHGNALWLQAARSRQVALTCSHVQLCAAGC